MFKDEMSSEDEYSDSVSDSLLTEEQLLDGKKRNSGTGIIRPKWTKEEDTDLKILVEQHGEKWDIIAKHFTERTDIQCQQRWCKVVNPDLIKGPWTREVSCFSTFIQFQNLICI